MNAKSALTSKIMLYKKVGFLLIGVANTLNCLAHDGANHVPVKNNAPINYYQSFMIGVAIAYGLYLLIRARRRKRSSQYNNNTAPTTLSSRKMV